MNQEKTTILFSLSTDVRTKTTILLNFRVKKMGNKAIYLGNLLNFGKKEVD